MNTTDLRDTLASHAAFDDDALTARVVGVRERVRVVRRRRAAVGGTVAAVLAIGAVGLALPNLTNDAAPASRDLAGHTAPATLESLGYTYSFERGVEGDGEVVITVPKSDEPSLITWATQGGDDRVIVRSDGGEDPYRSSRADFTDFTMTGPSDSAMEYTLTGDGPIGVAVYQPAADQAPAGVTKDDFTYRDQVDGGTLLAAEIGDAGDSELDLTFTMPTGGLTISTLCETSRPRMVSVSFNGSGGVATSCQVHEGRDAGSASRWGPDEVADKSGRTIRAGEKVRVRVWVSDRRSPSRKLAEDDSVRLGVGIYSLPQVSVAGFSVDEFVEFDGHLWRLAEREVGAVGSDRVRLRVAGRAPRVVSFVARNTGTGIIRMARFGPDGKPLESGGDAWASTIADSMSSGGYDLVTEDAVVGLTTEGQLVGLRTQFVLLGYERVD
ncbi:hypothetical protein [Nocardioides speluncae]|uniref:hypothetical protein n=1 Tax=Nocardioides speluncae TaxID=2670337 RepID=UPI000D695636|nr:hypothetical protein [Nocardioides speluncae]